MAYFIIPAEGGYKVVEKGEETATLCSPWFETYTLAEKWLERQIKKQQVKGSRGK